jgi:hypothetical protein
MPSDYSSNYPEIISSRSQEYETPQKPKSNQLSKSNTTIHTDDTQANLDLEILINALYVASPVASDSRKSSSKKSKNLVKFFGLPSPNKSMSQGQESDLNSKSRPSQSTMKNSTSSIFSDDSVSTHSEIDSINSEDVNLLRELFMESESDVEDDDINPSRKGKDLTKLLGTPKLKPSPQKSIQITRHKPRRSIFKLFKKDGPIKYSVIQKPTNKLESLLGESKETIYEVLELPEVIEALYTIKTVIEERKYAKANNVKESSESIKKLKLLGVNAQMAFKNAIKRFNDNRARKTALVDQESCFSFLSVNEQIREIENQAQSIVVNEKIPEIEKIVVLEESDIKTEVLTTNRIVDLIRMDKSKWTNKPNTYFDDSYVKKMINLPKSKSNSKTVKTETLMSLDDYKNIAIEERKSQETTHAIGVDIDTILERIYGDDDFKISILFDPFPNQVDYPELFGDITKEDQELFNITQNQKEATLSSSPSSSSTNSYEKMNHRLFSKSMIHFKNVPFEDQNHPLDRLNQEPCDLREIDILFQRHRLLLKERSNMSQGALQLQALNEVMDDNPDLIQKPKGIRQLAALNAVMDQNPHLLQKQNVCQQLNSFNGVLDNSPNLSRAKTTIDLNISKHIRRSLTLKELDRKLERAGIPEPSNPDKNWDILSRKPKEYKSLVKYMFESRKPDIFIDGLGSREMDDLNSKSDESFDSRSEHSFDSVVEYSYEELWSPPEEDNEVQK